MTVFELVATLTLDSSAYDKGLQSAQGSTKKAGGMIGSTLGKLKGKIAAAFGVGAMVAFGKKAVETGMQFDTAMSQVAATMGKTMEEMKQETGEVQLAWGKFSGNLRDYAQEMGAHTKFSASEAAEALNYMALAGYDTQKSMEMLPNVLNLAAAGAMDLGKASDMVTDISSALGLKQEQTNLMVDQLAMTASKANASVEQLGSGMLRVGGTAKMMKGGTVELSAALGILADNGTKGAEGGTALRNILTTISGKKFEKTFGAMGVSAFDAEGKMRSLKDVFADVNTVLDGMSDEEKIKTITSAFNARDLKNVQALLGTTSERWDELTGNIERAWYTNETLNASLLKLGTGKGLSKLKEDFETAGISGEKFDKLLGKSGGDAEDFANRLVKASKGSLTLQDVTKMLGGDLDKLQTAFDETTGSAQQMADTQLDNLAGDITIMKSAFEGLQIAISDTATGPLRGFVQGITEVFSTLTGAIKAGDLQGALSVFGEAWSNIHQSVLNGLRLATVAVKDNLPIMISSFLTGMVDLSAKANERAGQLVDVGLRLVKSIAMGIIQNIPTIIQTVPTIISNFANIINNNAPKVIATGWEIIKALAKGLVDAFPVLLENIPQILMAIWNVFTAFNWLELGGTVIRSIGKGIKSIGESIPSALKSIGKKGMNAIKNINWADVGGTIIKLMVKGVTALVALPSTILKKAASLGMKAFTSIGWGNVGKETLELIGRGITAAIAFVTDAVRGVVDKVKGFFPISIGNIISGLKLPHFSISGKFSLNPPSVPHFGVNWYKKAMNMPYVFDKATLFGAGEAGDEMLYGRKALMDDIKEATGDGSKVININITNNISNAEDPEGFADRLTRRLELNMRSA